MSFFKEFFVRKKKLPRRGIGWSAKFSGSATQQWQWGQWPWERRKGRGDEIWVGHTTVAMRTVALRNRKGRDLSQPHNSGNEDGGLENVGKAKIWVSHTTVAMRTVALRTSERLRSESATWVAMRTLALRASERPRSESATQQWQWGRWPQERRKGRGDEIWVGHITVALRMSERPRRRDLSQPHNSGNEDGGLENVGKAEIWVSYTTVAMRMVALRTSERPRSESATQQWQWGRWPWERRKGRDLSQPHNSGNEDGGLENVGKAEATRSELATQQRPWERRKGRDLSQPHNSGSEDGGLESVGKAEIWVSHTTVAMRTVALRTSERLRRRDLSRPNNSGNEDGGLENVRKAEARSESATQQWQWGVVWQWRWGSRPGQKLQQIIEKIDL